MAQDLNLQSEFDTLMAFIRQTWDIADDAEFSAAAKEAFNRGIHDGRFFFDSNIPYQTSVSLFRKEEEDKALSGEESPAQSKDPLQKFALSLLMSSMTLSSNVFEQHDYIRFSNATYAALGCAYKSLKKCEPKTLPSDIEKNLVDTYAGFKAEGVRFSCTTKRLSPSFVVNSKENHGTSFANSLIVTIYSHGLGCMQQKNDLTLCAVLSSLYEHFGHQPRTEFDLNKAKEWAGQHELVKFIAYSKANKNEPFKSVLDDFRLRVPTLELV